MGVACVGVVYVSSILKEELARAIDKWLRVISNTITLLKKYRIKPF